MSHNIPPRERLTKMTTLKSTPFLGYVKLFIYSMEGRKMHKLGSAMAQLLESSNNWWLLVGSILILTTQGFNWQLEGWQSASLPQQRCPSARHCTPMLPGQWDWLPTAPVYGICLMSLCSTGANLDGLNAEEKFHAFPCTWQFKKKK